MQPRDPAYRETVQAIFASAPFIADLGIALDAVEPGRCSSSLVITGRHLQQDGFIHAGVVATMADHTAGACAGSLKGPDEVVLTSTFTIHLLRPAVGERLACRASALRAGRTQTVVESEVFAIGEGGEKLVAKATVTLALVRAAARPSP
jgi:uncharacterized protein (TIGR00369 family)